MIKINKYIIKYNETYHVTKCNHHIIMYSCNNINK